MAAKKTAATKVEKKKQGKPDAFEAIGVLFLRLLQRDSTEAPAVLVSPGRGSSWVAAVFVGEPPKELRDMYLRGGTGAEARVSNVASSWRVATGSSGAHALEKLVADLREALAARIVGDMAAWTRATGQRFKPPPVAALVPAGADPHTQAPGDFVPGTSRTAPERPGSLLPTRVAPPR